jgi:hypothetical protein
MKKLLACAAASVLLAGCALDTKTAAEPADDKEYRTGSNIPARTRAGVRTTTPEEIESQRAQTIGNIPKRPGAGN